MTEFDINSLRFDAHGLIPTIVQDFQTGQVLMMAYMNAESLKKTMETGETWFWSRSRQQLWHKGETSGHYQAVKEMSYDCDADAILIKVVQTGAACHTGEKTCFHNGIFKNDKGGYVSPEILNELYDVIKRRKTELPEGSYTTYLFTKGLDKILKKVGEETAEVIIGAKNRDKNEVIYEAADLMYHLLVLLCEQDIDPQEVFAELAARR